MKLDFDTVKSITFGAERIENERGVIKFFRFTKEEENFYENQGSEWRYGRSFDTAGIRFSFVSDTTKLSFSYKIGRPGARSFAYFDIYVCGGLYSHFGKENKSFKEGFAEVAFPEGEKHIEVYFPWSCQTAIYNLCIDDGAKIIPKKRNKTMISFGDSITQGFDAKYPSLTYASQLARLLGADALNKGIASEKFCPGLLIEKRGNPDYVTVAYGINDCHSNTYENVKESSRKFYKRISELYKDSKIFAISPVCCLNDTTALSFGKPASEVYEIVREACAGLDNVTVIRGWEFTPALTGFYSDLTLHPNDLGFSIYALNIYKEIRGSL